MPVFLPLQSLERCVSCQAKHVRHLCSACGEVTYCSATCQKSDWVNHKNQCGKTDRVDLKSFYPVLACLAEIVHCDSIIPPHEAISHQITNADPNPGMKACVLPDGTRAKLIVLGRKLESKEIGTQNWWPKAMTPKVMSKMFRRIQREGYLLPILMSLCFGLVAEMYTTTSGAGSDKRRVRLKYKTSPISDFGICAGSAEVTNEDILAYELPNKEILMGQDPDDHYWIYFTTVKGETVTLDLGFFTFNMCTIVPTAPYVTSEDKLIAPFAPAFLRDRTIDDGTPVKLVKESRRVSFLRNTEVHDLVSEPNFWEKNGVASKLVALMDSISGEDSDVVERRVLITSTVRTCKKLRDIFQAQRWQHYPPEPLLAIEQDPEETENQKANKNVKKIMKDHQRSRKHKQKKT